MDYSIKIIITNRQFNLICDALYGLYSKSDNGALRQDCRLLYAELRNKKHESLIEDLNQLEIDK